MDKNIELYLTGALGIGLGVLVTFLSIDKLSEKVMTEATKLGGTIIEAEKYKENLNQSIEELKKLKEAHSNLVSQAQNQTTEAQRIQQQLENLSKSVTELNSESGKAKLKAVTDLVGYLENNKSIEKLLEIETRLNNMDQSLLTMDSIRHSSNVNDGKNPKIYPIGEFRFCALAGISWNFGSSGSNKTCEISPESSKPRRELKVDELKTSWSFNEKNNWAVHVYSEAGQNISCTYVCID